MARAKPPFFIGDVFFGHYHVSFQGCTKNDSYAIIKMGRLIPGSILFRLLLRVRKYGKTPLLLVAVVSEYLQFFFVTDAPPEDLLSSSLKAMMGLETKIRLLFGIA